MLCFPPDSLRLGLRPLSASEVSWLSPAKIMRRWRYRQHHLIVDCRPGIRSTNKRREFQDLRAYSPLQPGRAQNLPEWARCRRPDVRQLAVFSSSRLAVVHILHRCRRRRRHRQDHHHSPNQARQYSASHKLEFSSYRDCCNSPHILYLEQTNFCERDALFFIIKR